MATEGDSAASALSGDPLSPTSEQGKSQDGSDFAVPSHLLGRTVDNPAADIVGAVKPHQKPRLGVRVPYLNLTSQIVSQDEIAAELAERAQKKNPAMADSNKVGDMFFTMKMTHRLVKSIKPVFPEKGQIPDQQFSAADPPVASAPTQSPEGGSSSSNANADQNSLQNQLLETLENDSSSLDESVLEPSLSRKEAKKMKSFRKPRVHVALDRELERQLALQQLQEFNVQKQVKKEMKVKMKEELKEMKMKEQLKPKKRSRKLSKLKNIVINRRLDETEAPILPYKSIQRKHKVTIGVVPVNGAETTPKITANVNEVTEAPPEVPDIKVPNKDNRYMKKYTNKRYSEDTMNGSNEIIDEIASEILDPTPKKKLKKSKAANNSNSAVEGNSPLAGKRKSGRKLKATEKAKALKKGKASVRAANDKPSSAVVENGSMSVNNESQPDENEIGENNTMETETEAPEIPQDVLPDTEGGKKSRMMREIDRLLMDEGAINMLYSIEEKRSPKNSKEKPKLLPSTRRKKRDLLLKTKLVKSAVLKLSGSPKNKSRVQRQSIKLEEADPDEPRKVSVDSHESVPGASPKPSSSLPAEASRIIRRHSSSSSFSSTAGSPRRVSTDFEHPLPNLTPDGASTSGRKLKKRGSTNKSKRALSPKKDPQAPAPIVLKIAKNPGSVPNQSASGKISSPIKNDVRTEMSKNFNKKASSSKNVIRKTLYAEEKTLNSSNVATPSSSAMPPPQGQSTPAPTSTPGAKAVASQPTANASYSKRSSSMFIETLASREFVEKLERLDKQQARLPPAIPILPKVECYREVSIRKVDRLIHIVLTPAPAKVKNALSIRILREILGVLQQAESDKNCQAVLLTSTGPTFCQGIDFESLIEDDPEKRKIIVVELAIAIRDFIYGIGMFNKLLVAGVHGPAVGLGVMMLPYFDMVFASDKATFYTPYMKLGQVPEGAPALSMMHMLSNAATSELIYGCRQLTASEALRCGLVTRILWPDRFQEELMPIVTEISSHATQAMEATKTLMRRNMRSQLNMALAAECHLLVKNWNTTECQENFKKFLEDDSFWQITK